MSRKVFEERGDAVLRDMVSGHGKDSLMVEVDDPSGLFQS